MGASPSVPAEVAPPPPVKRPSGVRRAALALVTSLSLCAMALGIVGQVCRDRNVLLAMLMYVPLVPLGAGAVVIDLLRRGRSVRPRFAFFGAGVVSLAVGGVPMLALRSPDALPPDARPITLLHWNMQSGGRLAAQPRWQRAADSILARQPDVIVLSEAPPDAWLFHSLKNHEKANWKTVHISNEPGQRYWYKPLVCSKWPMEMEGQVPVRNGVAMSVTVNVRGRELRLLVVDGVSNIPVVRTPFLHDIAAACDAAARAGRPYDVVVGDFNSVGRSIGFDAVRSAAGGYKRASDYSRGWRATWPVPLPVYDIDHVLVREGASVAGCEIFSSHTLDTDHRGQFVTFCLPAGPPIPPMAGGR